MHWGHNCSSDELVNLNVICENNHQSKNVFVIVSEETIRWFMLFYRSNFHSKARYIDIIGQSD